MDRAAHSKKRSCRRTKLVGDMNLEHGLATPTQEIVEFHRIINAYHACHTAQSTSPSSPAAKPALCPYRGAPPCLVAVALAPAAAVVGAAAPATTTVVPLFVAAVVAGSGTPLAEVAATIAGALEMTALVVRDSTFVTVAAARLCETSPLIGVTLGEAVATANPELKDGGAAVARSVGAMTATFVTDESSELVVRICPVDCAGIEETELGGCAAAGMMIMDVCESARGTVEREGLGAGADADFCSVIDRRVCMLLEKEECAGNTEVMLEEVTADGVADEPAGAACAVETGTCEVGAGDESAPCGMEE